MEEPNLRPPENPLDGRDSVAAPPGRREESWLPSDTPPAYTAGTRPPLSEETSWFQTGRSPGYAPGGSCGDGPPPCVSPCAGQGTPPPASAPFMVSTPPAVFRPPRPMPPVPPSADVYPPGGGSYAFPYGPPAAFPPPVPAPPVVSAGKGEAGSALRAVIAGRPFTRERRERLGALLRRRDRLYLSLAALQMTLFTLLAQLLIWPRRNIGDMIIAWAVLAVSLIVFFLLWSVQMKTLSRSPVSEGSPLPDQVTELYGDRAVVIRAEERAVVRFSRIRWVEEGEGLLAAADHCQLVTWAQEDLTPYDYALLKATLFQAVPPALWHTRRGMTPLLREPLPLPIFAPVRPERQVRLPCPPGTVRWAWFSREELPRLLQRVVMLLPALAALASVYGFTVYYAVDIALFALILGAFAGLLEGGRHWLRSRELRRRSPLRITLVPRGAAVHRGDNTWFFTLRQLRPAVRRGAVYLSTPWGRLRLRREAAEDPDALRAWFDQKNPEEPGPLQTEEDTPPR